MIMTLVDPPDIIMIKCQIPCKTGIKIIKSGSEISETPDSKLFFCKKIWDELNFSVAVSETICEKCKKDNKVFKKLRAHVVERFKQQEPYRQLSILEMSKNFTRAMTRAAKKGFKKVDKRTYIERQMCCTTCGAIDRCIYCGCYLRGERFSKCILDSESGCPNPKTYPNLKRFPPRNYWSVCNEITSVIIPARNEVYLNRTIENILANATGKIEVIVVLDGYDYDVLDNEKVRVIKHKEPLGIRASINEAARIALGQYLFKLDAHCTMSKGWDTKLKCACDDRSIAVSVIRPLDRDTWQIPEKATYMSFVYLDRNFQWQWWPNYNPGRRLNLIEETPSFIGLAYMIRKDYFDLLGGFDDLSIGKYGFIGPELSLKVWLHRQYPGKILIRLDVICGHLFYKNTDESPHKEYTIPFDQWRQKVFDRWGDHAYKLIEKFVPVLG